MINLLRKVLLLMLATFVRNQGARAIGVCVVLSLALLIHLKVHPYERLILNIYETVLLTSLATAAWMLLIAAVHSTFLNAASVLCIISLLLGLIVMLHAVIAPRLPKLCDACLKRKSPSKRGSCAKRCLGCARRSDPETWAWARIEPNPFSMSSRALSPAVKKH